MTPEQMLSEIREANLSYLMLAQSLIRADREQALYRLGISEEAAAHIAALSPSQVQKVASVNTLICRMRAHDDQVWRLLTQRGKAQQPEALSRLHATILMAGRHAEAL